MENKRTDFSFSEPFLGAYLVENVKDYSIDAKTIVLNLGKRGVEMTGDELKPLSSSVYSKISIEKAEKLACIELEADLDLRETFPFSEELKAKWQHVHEIFPLPQLKKTKLWRSGKERIRNIEFNLWFASAGTNCGLHNKHEFREIHTQVYGLGRMQKFLDNDIKSLYNEVFMGPGHTHGPFYNKKGEYPWHQYYADSDCIWMAVEFYD